MAICSAFGCFNRTDRKRKHGVSFHKFPKDKGLRKKWIKAVRRSNWEPGVNSYLCSEHFSAEFLNRTFASGRTELKENAVPTIFSYNPELAQPSIKKTNKISSTVSSTQKFSSAKESLHETNGEEPSEIPSRLFKEITSQKLNRNPSTCFADVFSNHGLIQRNEDFKFCLFLFHEMQVLSDGAKKNLRKSFQKSLLQAFEDDGLEA